MQDEAARRRLLTVTTRAVGGKWAEVCVEDTGKGLSEDALDQIFEPFFTTKAEGLGLGLAISRSIVENHGGSLSAVMSRRRGGVFRFRLPAAGVLG
jgi:signal transduction histidine kinase